MSKSKHCTPIKEHEEMKRKYKQLKLDSSPNKKSSMAVSNATEDIYAFNKKAKDE